MTKGSLITMKRKSFSIIVLIILAIYIIRPVLPFIEYSILRNYISTYLCVNKGNPESTCNGKCYLHDQLQKAGEPLDGDKDNNKKSNPERNMEDHLKSEEITQNLSADNHDLIFYLNQPIPESFLSIVFVPPRF